MLYIDNGPFSIRRRGRTISPRGISEPLSSQSGIYLLLCRPEGSKKPFLAPDEWKINQYTFTPFLVTRGSTLPVMAFRICFPICFHNQMSGFVVQYLSHPAAVLRLTSCFPAVNGLPNPGICQPLFSSHAPMFRVFRNACWAGNAPYCHASV